MNYSKDYRFSKSGRLRCWEKCFGNSNVGYCYSCKKTLYLNAEWDYGRGKWAWEAGHIRAKARGGSDNPMRNCIVLCVSCNRRMQTEHPDKWDCYQS